MQFTFIPRGRFLSDRAFLADLRRVAKLVGNVSLTQDAYKKYGRYRPGAHARFGKWSTALHKAGLKPAKQWGVKREALVEDIRRVADQLKISCITQTQYLAAARYSHDWVQRHFESWQSAAAAAGLSAPTTFVRKTTAELFNNLEHVWLTLGRQPSCTEMVPPLSKFGQGAYLNRFGSWQKALLRFANSRREGGGRKSPPVPAGVHKTPRGITIRLRYEILRRDDFRCRACGRSPATDRGLKLQVDHIKPWSKGGETVEKNLQTLCQQCNRGKFNLHHCKAATSGRSGERHISTPAVTTVEIN